jgi:hypothetical protein
VRKVAVIGTSSGVARNDPGPHFTTWRRDPLGLSPYIPVNFAFGWAAGDDASNSGPWEWRKSTV